MGRLLKVVDKQVQFYRTVENSPQEHTVNNEEVTTGKLFEVVNLLVESMEFFKEDIYGKLEKMETKTPKSEKMTGKKEINRQDNHQKLDQNLIITTLKKENERLKEEVSAQQSIINRLMKNNEKNTEAPKKKIHAEESKKVALEKKKEEKVKDYIEIVGDSMLNGFEERGLCKNHRVKVRKHPGATSTDLLDHIKPVLRKKPDKLIIYVGTNDITNKINLLENMKTIAKLAKKESPNTKLCFSGLVKRYDITHGEKLVDDINNQLKSYCLQNKHDFINNSNIGENELGKRKLHPNKQGLKMMVKNFLLYFS